jgi:RecB family exonuclease
VVIEGRAVRYGRPAAALLADRVRAAKGGDALAPVTVVVPSNYAAVAARRALAARPGGVANVTFTTLHRLAERLGAARLAAAGRLPVSVPVLTQAVRAELQREPGVFLPVADHPATEQALVRATQELAGVPPEALDDVAACSDRAKDVVRIARSVRAGLAAGWHDEQDLLEAATAAVDDGASAEGPVITYLLQELTAGGAALVAALGRRSPVEAVVGITGESDADAPVLAAHERAEVSVSPDPSILPASAGRVVRTSDPDEEVRAAVRLVTGWMRDDVPLGRIAVLYGLPDPYSRLLHEHLAAAGIARNGAPVRAVADLLVGRTLRALLALPDRGFRRADVLAVLTGAPVLDEDEPVPSRAWERVSRKAGVVQGDDWDERLARLAADNRRLAEKALEDEWERRAAGLQRDAERAEALARFVVRVRAALDEGRGIGTWAGLSNWASGLVERYLGDERHRRRWPEEERRAADRVQEALDRLGCLDALGGPRPDLGVFRRALDGELDAALGRVGRLGDGVLVGQVSMAAGLVLDRVVVLGLAEGSFPPRRLEDSLLPDAEREAAGGALALRTKRLHDDRRHLLAALAAADEAVLCSPRGDLRRSGERPASRWLLADAARLAGEPVMRTEDLAKHHGAPWLDDVPSFAGGLRRVVAPASEQELRLAAVARGEKDHPALAGDPILAAAADVVDQRRSAAFTRFDGNLAALADELPPVERTSASRLQTWAECPHAYFLHHLLGVEPVEEPERRLTIDAIDRGNLVHGILDEFVSAALVAGSPPARWTEAHRVELHRIAASRFADYEAEGRTGRDLLWRVERDRIDAELDLFLTKDDERLAAGLRPRATELRFDDLAVNLPSGRTLRVRGSIDRVDQRADGSLVVIDYKTGSSRAYSKLCESNPHLGGTRLQLYLYSLAAAAEFGPGPGPVCSTYWFTSTKGEWRWLGYSVTPDVQAEVAAAIDTIVTGIAGGVFPPHPSEQPKWKWVDCWYCTPDGLSGADRRRDFERKARRDGALADYARLAEPELLDAG